MGSTYGEAEKEVMQNLLSMGHTKVEDLRDAYQAKFNQAARIASAANGATNGATNHDDEAEFDAAGKDERTGLFVKSLQHLDDVLCRLIQAELVISVSESSFRSWEDMRSLIEDEVKKNYFAGGVRGAKGKEEFTSKLGKRLGEVRDGPFNLKRKLHTKIQMNKRRKLADWSSANTSLDGDDDLILDVRYP